MTIPNSIAAFGSLAAFALIGFAGAASAHDPEKGARVERIIILDKGEAAKKGAKAPLRRVEIVRLHEDGPGRCAGEVSDVDTASGGERTRIRLCAPAKGNAEERIKRLEEALGRIREDDRISADHRAKVETALQDAIARLRDAK
jgi:glycerate kinase